MARLGGAWTHGGAVVSAALASMCCILPLGLGVAGLSTTAVAAFFEPLRPWFLTLAALLLVVGFYLAFRAPAAGTVCDTDSRPLARLSKPTLWLSTVAVLALALFPSLAGVAAGGGSELAPTISSEVVELRIDGMTCEACTSDIRANLLDVPGVIDAAVSYEHERARIRVRAERPPGSTALVAAVERAGYSATEVTR